MRLALVLLVVAFGCSVMCPDGDLSCVTSTVAPSAKLCSQNPGGLDPGAWETCDQQSTAFPTVTCYVCWDGPAHAHLVLGEPGDDPCFFTPPDVGAPVLCIASCSSDANIHASCGSYPQVHN